jgi:hypothetical protein
MEKNFTPLKIESFYKDKNAHNGKFDGLANTIFLFLATITVLVICIVLFLLIQKNIKRQTGKLIILPVITLRMTYHG